MFDADLQKFVNLGPMRVNRKTLGIIWAVITVPVLSPLLLPQTLATPNTGYSRCDIELAVRTPGLTHIPEPPAGRIRIMPTRYSDLERASIGYEKTGVPLVAYDGRVFGPAGVIDDFGAYYFIPQIAARFGLSLRRSIDVFYMTLLVAAVGLGVFGCCLALRTRIGKIYAIVELVLVSALAYRFGDVYILLAATVIAIAPLALYVSGIPRPAITIPFVVGSGLVISIANAIRSHSGTGVLLFLLCLVLTRFAGGNYQKIVLICMLLGVLVLPNLYFSRIVGQRDKFVRSQCPSYPKLSVKHVFWHAVYAGFGYLRNDEVAGYNDQVAYDKVQSIAPGTLYGSSGYEKVLRQQVWLLVQLKPSLVLYTIASKLGVICAMFLLFANVGLIGATIAPKPKGLEVAFWLGIVFDSLFGILVVPLMSYLLGLVAFATLYGAVSLDLALQKKLKQNIVRSLTARSACPADTTTSRSPFVGRARKPL